MTAPDFKTHERILVRLKRSGRSDTSWRAAQVRKVDADGVHVTLIGGEYRGKEACVPRTDCKPGAKSAKSIHRVLVSFLSGVGIMILCERLIPGHAGRITGIAMAALVGAAIGTVFSMRKR